ncbi:hypothetical protein [Staphylococcus equorum]|uniref:hypothetical protein n=1 Tax=Staphylococcus equorum TaxID=246432 RepID=UPI003CEE6915
MTIDWSILSNPLVVSIGGAIVGWSLTQFTNSKRMEHEKEINDMKLKADVVVKSRMEWIEDVRNLSANLIQTYTEMYSTNEKANTILQSVNKMSKENNSLVAEYADESDENKKNTILIKIKSNLEELRELKNNYEALTNELLKYVGKFSEMKFLFKSYFSEINIDGSINESNKDLLDIMETCASLLSKYCTNPSEVSKEQLQQSLDNFMNKVSNYLKIEWEKVKRIE